MGSIALVGGTSLNQLGKLKKYEGYAPALETNHPPLEATPTAMEDKSTDINTDIPSQSKEKCFKRKGIPEGIEFVGGTFTPRDG